MERILPRSLDPLVQALIQCRKEQRVSQADLAEAAGITRRALVAIENNASDPTLGTLRALFTALGHDILARPFESAPTLDDILRENDRGYGSKAEPDA
ncbi:helix-turn-helix domain-containing protein [Achromobacter aloeverae]|nr:helix-turn-helix transcriptional regulator [Achromobacter aloeverae]